MNQVNLKPTQTPLTGEISVPGDKSISHRAIIFGSLAKGETRITRFLTGDDCLMTIKTFQAMGVDIKQQVEHVFIISEGVEGLKELIVSIYLGNSGTSAKLLLCNYAILPFH